MWYAVYRVLTYVMRCRAVDLGFKFFVLLFILNIIVIAIPVEAQRSNVFAPINWVQYIDLTTGNDVALGTCLFGDYLAVVGYAGSDEYSRGGSSVIVLLDRSSGYVVQKQFGVQGVSLINCISMGDKLYVVGSGTTADGFPSGRFYMLDKNFNILKSSIYTGTFFLSIASNGIYIYIGGVTRYDRNLDGRPEDIVLIERRTQDLEFVNSVEIYFDGWVSGGLFDLRFNPVTGMLWGVGIYSDSSATSYSLITIFDQNLNVVRYIRYPNNHNNYLGVLSAIDFDEYGNAYVLGERGIARFDPYGNLVLKKSSINGTQFSKIVYAKQYVYVFQSENIDGYPKHVMYVFDRELNLLAKYILSNQPSYFLNGRPTFDGDNIYVAGIDYIVGNARWIVYSISTTLPTNTITIHQTITKTVTTTETMSTTITSFQTITLTATATTTVTEQILRAFPSLSIDIVDIVYFGVIPLIILVLIVVAWRQYRRR